MSAPANPESETPVASAVPLETSAPADALPPGDVLRIKFLKSARTIAAEIRITCEKGKCATHPRAAAERLIQHGFARLAQEGEVDDVPAPRISHKPRVIPADVAADVAAPAPSAPPDLPAA